MANLLKLSDVPHTIYQTSPLVLALCQIRFASVLSVADPTFVVPFQRAILDHYPITKPQEQVDMEVNIVEGEPQVKRGSPFRTWRFTDTEDNWAVILAHDFLAIETRRYDHFEDFIGQLRLVSEALIDHIKPTVGIRLGLRYINEIRSDNRDWSSTINKDLLGPLAIEGFAQSVEQGVQELVLRFPKGQGVNVRHGHLSQGTTVQPRPGDQISTEPFYLLDYDIFQEFIPPNVLRMHSDHICALVAEYHENIYRLFRWSVTDQFTATLGERL